MTDRFPLVVDSSTNTVKELPAADDLSTGGSGLKAGITSITVDSSEDALHVRQTGSGYALHVSDENPDNTPFVVTGIGSVGIGTLFPDGKLHIVTQDTKPAVRIVQDNPSTDNFPLIVSRSDSQVPLFRISGIGSVGIGTTVGSDFTIYKNFDNGVGSGSTRGVAHLSWFAGANGDRPPATSGSSLLAPVNWAPGWAYSQLTVSNAGQPSAGIATTTTEFYNHNVVLGFFNQDPRLLNKQHGTTCYMVLSTNEVENTTYGGGKLDFYIRGNTPPYSFPHNPYVSSYYWMESLLTIDGVSKNVGIGSSLPAKKLHLNGTFRFTSRGTPSTQTALHINTSTGDVVETASSRRFKRDIEDYDKGLETLLQLRPVSFKFLEEERVNAGLIAEEVADLGLEEFVIREEDGTPRSIPYENLTALLIKAIQDLKAEVQDLKAEVDTLKAAQ